jgi:hypothetical protein
LPGFLKSPSMTESKTSSTSVSKTIIIRQALDAATRNFTASIALNFTPDEVIVRQIVYKAVVAETAVYSLYTDMTGSYLGSFFDGTSVAPQSAFKLTNFTNNTFNFGVHEAANTLTTAALGVLCVVLEFRTL